MSKMIIEVGLRDKDSILAAITALSGLLGKAPETTEEPDTAEEPEKETEETEEKPPAKKTTRRRTTRKTTPKKQPDPEPDDDQDEESDDDDEVDLMDQIREFHAKLMEDHRPKLISYIKKHDSIKPKDMDAKQQAAYVKFLKTVK